MATGDCRAFAATISGLAPTSLNPVTAGWTQLTGTSDLGQTATKCLILDNGIKRTVLDKNDNNQGSCSDYGFNGSAWKLLWDSVEVHSFTVASVARNDVKSATLNLTWLNPTATITASMSMTRGIPAVGFRITNVTVENGDSDIRFVHEAGGKTLLTPPSGGIAATDKYGFTGNNDFNPTTQNFLVLPDASSGGDLMVAVAQDEQMTLTRAPLGFLHSSLAAGEYPHHVWLGFLPRTYGMGDGGGANVGNGDGQLREAEDNYTSGGGVSWTAGIPAGSSSTKTITDSSPANGHFASWVLNFPSPGVYYILVPQIRGTANLVSRLSVTGATGTAFYDATLTVEEFTSVDAHALYGPYTIPAAGNYTVVLTCQTVGSATYWLVDFLAIFPYEATASTPTSFIFAKNLAHSLLRQVALA